MPMEEANSRIIFINYDWNKSQTEIKTYLNNMVPTHLDSSVRIYKSIDDYSEKKKIKSPIG